jgi:hypothetical protein
LFPRSTSADIYYLSPKGISFRDYCNKKNWSITLEIPLAGFLSINCWHESNQRFFGMTKKVACSRMQDVFTGRLCPK